MSETLASVLVALADDELVLGHRHSEWTGYAPHIEEDVAFSSIAQDEIGHAAAYYSLAGKLADKEPDTLAFGRTPKEYRNALLCERPNQDWAYTLARHWLYDTADDVRLEVLEASGDRDLAALVYKIRREERYHLGHADLWMKRIAHGPVEGRNKLVNAVGEAYPDSLGLFEPFDEEEEAVAQGLLPLPSSEMSTRFAARAAEALDVLGIRTTGGDEGDAHAEFVASSSGDLLARDEDEGARPPAAPGTGGRAGRHSPDFEELWNVMTHTYRAHPGATW